jgi:cell shape-determining protein MreC
MVFLAMQERELDLRLQHSEEMLQELTEARRENRLLQQKLRAAQSSSGGENALVFIFTFNRLVHCRNPDVLSLSYLTNFDSSIL